jgi:hypothetical protein
MRIVKLDGAPCKKRPCDVYEAARAGFVVLGPKMDQILCGMEDRILRMPLLIGKRSKDPPDSRHVKVAEHYTLWWRYHQATNEVEFLDIGHHDDFFRR